MSRTFLARALPVPSQGRGRLRGEPPSLRRQAHRLVRGCRLPWRALRGQGPRRRDPARPPARAAQPLRGAPRVRHVPRGAGPLRPLRGPAHRPPPHRAAAASTQDPQRAAPRVERRRGEPLVLQRTPAGGGAPAGRAVGSALQGVGLALPLAHVGGGSARRRRLRLRGQVQAIPDVRGTRLHLRRGLVNGLWMCMCCPSFTTLPSSTLRPPSFPFFFSLGAPLRHLLLALSPPQKKGRSR